MHVGGRTAKTTIFALLAAAVAFPLLTVTDMMQADGQQYGDTIPDEGLIPRTDEWRTQYESVEDFEAAGRQISAYVSSGDGGSDWSRVIIKEHVRIYNFETIAGRVGINSEVVALLAQRDRLEGGYQASQPVQKYHEWLMSKHPPPDTVSGVDARLLEILGDDRIIGLARDLARSYASMAEHGSVPLELADQDRVYWGRVTGIAICDYNDACDGDARRANLGIDSRVTEEQWNAFQLFESTNGIDPETGEPYECIFIQCAGASSWTKIIVPRSLYVSIQPPMCQNMGTGLTCQKTGSWYGTGDKTLSSTMGGRVHAHSNYAIIKAYSDTVDPKALNEISGMSQVGFVKKSHGPVGGLDLARIWEGVDYGGGCGGHESQCGAYSFYITSPDAYKWVFG